MKNSPDSYRIISPHIPTNPLVYPALRNHLDHNVRMDTIHVKPPGKIEATCDLQNWRHQRCTISWFNFVGKA